jgi:microcystin-dependent protein
VANPFLGEIRLMSFNFPPKGWAPCNGQFLPINQNQALFALLGTTYGGNGQTTFALPDLRGLVPVHIPAPQRLGERGGELAHTLTLQELPQHVHVARASTHTSEGSDQPQGRYLGRANNAYHAASAPLTAMNPGTVTTVGGSQAHTNMQPYAVINFCIALQGVFPSPS